LPTNDAGPAPNGSVLSARSIASGLLIAGRPLALMLEHLSCRKRRQTKAAVFVRLPKAASENYTRTFAALRHEAWQFAALAPA
jgi:hypothetical protein